MYIEINKVENGFTLAVNEEEGYTQSVYTKPNQVIKAVKELMKPYQADKKARKTEVVELKVGG